MEDRETGAARRTRGIRSLDEVVDLLEDGILYVRYSRSHRDDLKRGYSLDHGTGTLEAGLSVQEIRPEDTREGRGWIARLLCEYRFASAGGYGWLARGRQVGRDSDGCPTIAGAEFVARLDAKLVTSCAAYARAYDERSRTDRGLADQRPWPRTEDFGL